MEEWQAKYDELLQDAHDHAAIDPSALKALRPKPRHWPVVVIIPLSATNA